MVSVETTDNASHEFILINRLHNKILQKYEKLTHVLTREYLKSQKQ